MKLVKISNNGQVVTTSQALAGLLNVEHEQIVGALSSISCSMLFAQKNFTLFESNGEPEYELTKDGAMLFLAVTFAADAADMEILIKHFNQLSDLLTKRDKLDDELSKLLS